MSEIEKHYKLLEVKETASIEEVKEAYRGLVKVWHPDRFGGDPKLQTKAQEKLKEINLAFETVMQHRSGKFNPASSPASKQPQRPKSTTDDAQQFYGTGMDYFEGKVTAKNYAEAAKWFKRAADLGHSPAQYYLGFLYSNANGLPLDFTAALRWYTMAAEQKNGAAMYQLGVLFAKGAHKAAGVRALKHVGLELGDKVEAYKWLYLATIYGVKEAITYIDHNNDATPLTAAGANEARLRAAYLFPDYPDLLPRELLGELVGSFLGVMRRGHASGRRTDLQLFEKVISKCKNIDHAVFGIAEQTYEFAKSEFLGKSSALVSARFKYMFGAEEQDDLFKKCAQKLVSYAAGNLPSDFALLRAKTFNHIWVKEVMPVLLIQKGMDN